MPFIPDTRPRGRFVPDAPQATEPEQRSAGEEAKRQLGLGGRMVMDTVAGLPLAALEGGAGVGNLISRATGGEGNVSFRRDYDEAMDRVFPKPENALEKTTQFFGTALLGSKIPAPTLKGGTAPEGFLTAKESARAAMIDRVRRAQESGYVIPPATSNPTAVTKTAEGVAGKLSTAQLASAQNMGTTDRLAAQALGQNAPLSVKTVQAVRESAWPAYEAVRGAGTIPLGQRWATAVDDAQAAVQGAGRAFPGLAKDDPLAARIDALRQSSVDSSDAVDAIKLLRQYADEAGAKGEKHAAGTYRKLASRLEDEIDAHLVSIGQTGVVENFRKARELIAKSYSVEKAMNKATGEVSAPKLANQLGKGAPLSGELRRIAEFAQAFPKAARPFNESLPGISPLDFYAAGGTAAVTAGLTGGNPLALLPLAYPFVRQGARAAVLSPLGQKLAVPGQGGPIRPEYVMALANAMSRK